MLERRRRVRPHNPNRVSFKPFLGMILMACAFFLLASNAAVDFVPWYAVVVTMLLWVFLLSVCVVWWTPFPERLPLVGVVAILLYFLTVYGGAFLLGWTA